MRQFIEVKIGITKSSRIRMSKIEALKAIRGFKSRRGLNENGTSGQGTPKMLATCGVRQGLQWASEQPFNISDRKQGYDSEQSLDSKSNLVNKNNFTSRKTGRRNSAIFFNSYEKKITSFVQIIDDKHLD